MPVSTRACAWRVETDPTEVSAERTRASMNRSIPQIVLFLPVGVEGIAPETAQQIEYPVRRLEHARPEWTPLDFWR